MGEFQLILLSDANRPARTTRASGEFSLISFREAVAARMGLALPDERKISAEEIATWYTPIEACAYAAGMIGTKGASEAIWNLLIAGMIEAVATTSSMTPKDRAPLPDMDPSFVPKRLWKSLSKHGTDLWQGGYARFWVSGTAYQCFGIKLNPVDVHANLPSVPQPAALRDKRLHAAAQQGAGEPKKSNLGGRPRKDWWDDFWIDICRQIYEGDLKPKTQAELERAMLGWATNHGHEMSEPTAKIAARKLFKAWKLGG
jgi:hypothetical protein